MEGNKYRSASLVTNGGKHGILFLTELRPLKWQLFIKQCVYTW